MVYFIFYNSKYRYYKKQLSKQWSILVLRGGFAMVDKNSPI